MGTIFPKRVVRNAYSDKCSSRKLSKWILTPNRRPRAYMQSRFFLASLFAFAIATPAAQHRHHWRETSSETIWTERYGNCDYGYYVTLPAGVLGHNELPPSPNHGFYVDLTSPASDRQKQDREHGVISVWNQYVMEPGEDPYTTALRHPRAGVVRKADGTEYHFSAARPTRLANLNAMLVKGRKTSQCHRRPRASHGPEPSQRY